MKGNRPRCIAEMIPCPTCGKPTAFVRTTTGWVRECAHGGIHLDHKEEAKTFYRQLPAAHQTIWRVRRPLGGEPVCWLIDGEPGVWRVIDLVSRDALWLDPGEGRMFATTERGLRVFQRFEGIESVGVPIQ